MRKTVKELQEVVTKFWHKEANIPTDLEGLCDSLVKAGITSKLHIGKTEEFFLKDKLNIVEWFLGCYVLMVEEKDLLGINSWINMKDIYLDSYE